MRHRLSVEPWREQSGGILYADLESHQRTVTEILAHAGVPARLAGRVKSGSSIWHKMQRYGIPLRDVHDLLGVRALVETVDDCYRVIDAVRSHWPAHCARLHDYIARPKPNGYRSIHLCVRLPAARPFELQVRTLEMHRHAEVGPSAHRSYKRAVERQSCVAGSAAAAAACAGPLRTRPVLGEVHVGAAW